jgi:hypothetical protein
MEQQTKLKLSNERAFYLIKHFESIDKKGLKHFQSCGNTIDEINIALYTLGSKFNSKFSYNPFDLINKINQYIPLEIIHQANGNLALIYKLRFAGGLGTCNVVNLKDIPKNERQNIKKIYRNGFEINVIKRNFLDITNQLIVIVTNNFDVITAFPGLYAPPFPNQLTNSVDVENSIKFWDNHVFIELIKI